MRFSEFTALVSQKGEPRLNEKIKPDQECGHMIDESETTVEVGDIPMGAFAIWNVVALSAGARYVFTYSGKSMCSFDSQITAANFVAKLRSDRRLPAPISVVTEKFREYFARMQEIKENPPSEDFVWQEC